MLCCMAIRNTRSDCVTMCEIVQSPASLRWPVSGSRSISFWTATQNRPVTSAWATACFLDFSMKSRGSFRRMLFLLESRMPGRANRYKSIWLTDKCVWKYTNPTLSEEAMYFLMLWSLNLMSSGIEAWNRDSSFCQLLMSSIILEGSRGIG